MDINDEIYKELTNIWWDVLSANEDISRFRDEFFTIALDDGYELEQIEDFWRS